MLPAPDLPDDYLVRASPWRPPPPGAERFPGLLLAACLKRLLAVTPGAAPDTLARALTAINRHLPDPADHLTPARLPQAWQFFNIEFSTVFMAVCAQLSGDPYFLAGVMRATPEVHGIYGMIPEVADRYRWLERYTRDYMHTDIRLEALAGNLMAARWPGSREALPPALIPLANAHVEMTLGTLFELMPTLSGLPSAQVTVTQTRRQGAPLTEWHIRWHEWPTATEARVWLWAGAAVSLGLGLVAAETVWGGAALLTLTGWLALQLRHRQARQYHLDAYYAQQHDHARAVLAEVERINQQLQHDNALLQQKVAELSALQDISATLSQMLSQDDVIDHSLRAVVQHLGFDQAALFLLDDARQRLLPGRLCGGPPALAADLARFTMPVRDMPTVNRQRWLNGQSFWVHHPDEVSNPDLRALMTRHSLREYIGVPLITRGEVIGLLTVHNGLTQRPLSADNARLLQTVGVQLANAIQSQRVYQSLETRVRARTLELQEALTQAEQARRTAEDLRALAEQATASKTEFLATMSHEIRNPLNGVMGATELLARTGLSPVQRELVENLMHSGLALRAVVNNVLDFSKIEAGHMELRPEPFRVHECVESALDVVAPLAVHHALDLTYVLAPGTPQAMLGDASRVRQILINLLSNAVKLTTRGEVVVQVRLAEKSPHQPPLWQFSVRDTGPGLTAEQQARLFTQYVQVNRAAASGTGLGLVISRNLAGLMGGQLWVESAGVPGQGATFHFTVRAPVTGAALLTAPPQWTGGALVGVKHSHPPTAQQVTYWLNQWGARVETDPQPGQPLAALVCDVRLAATLDNWGEARPPVVWVFAQAVHLPAEAVWRVSQPIKAEALRAALAGALGRGGEASPRPAAVGPNRQWAHVRVLLVEDNPVNQNLIVRMLQTLGYAPDVASHGREALDSLRQQDYDLVLMDVQMPEMDGLETTQTIRRTLPAHRQPHIVALTANAVQGERERCLQAGMDDFISKPISLNDLRQALERHHPAPLPAPPAEPAPHKAEPPRANPIEAKLRDLVEDIGRDNVQVIVDLYLVDAPQQVQEMQTAPPDRLKALAHRLRGSSAQVGALALAGLCAHIETDPAAAAPLVVQLPATLQTTLAEVRAALVEL